MKFNLDQITVEELIKLARIYQRNDSSGDSEKMLNLVRRLEQFRAKKVNGGSQFSNRTNDCEDDG